MLGTMRKAHKENTRTPSHLQQSSRQCLLEFPPSPLVFQDEIFRFKFINRQKNFVFIVSRILRYGTGGRSGLCFGQEQPDDGPKIVSTQPQMMLQYPGKQNHEREEDSSFRGRWEK